MQQVLFNELASVPVTEGIKYAGSKLKLLPLILQMIESVNPKTILDGFSGTTRVSQALAYSGYEVVCNDIAVWSKVFANCYLLNRHQQRHYSELIGHLNSIEGCDGWFTENYGANTNFVFDKRPWQLHNTRKLDGIREEIDHLNLDETERSVAITSLILALDEVDSTMGHFASYLREWSPRSYKYMKLKVPRINANNANHSVHQEDIFDILENTEVDLAYFDPPYGSNNEKMPPSRVRYAAYYHIWTTICLNDKPNIFGKAKRRIDSSDTVSSSIFEEFRRGESGRFIVVEAIEKLLIKTTAKYILLSYSSGGRATAEELNGAISKVGKLVDVMEMDYKRNVMADMRWTNEWIRDAEKPNREFLFLIEKN